jgi:hypothetical protein
MFVSSAGLSDDGFGGQILDQLSGISGFVRVSYCEFIFLRPAVTEFNVGLQWSKNSADPLCPPRTGCAVGRILALFLIKCLSHKNLWQYRRHIPTPRRGLGFDHYDEIGNPY